MSYKNLDVWKLARIAVIEIHSMSFTLPKFELLEEAQQIRRSSKTVKSCIVEGYAEEDIKLIILSS